MTVIETNHLAASNSPVLHRWLDPVNGVLARMVAHMLSCRAHPSRTLVLLPYAQLLPLARSLWAQERPDGFAPRFETTVSWARSMGPVALDDHDLAFDRGRDLLVAHGLLEQAGLADYQPVLTARLLEAAYALGPLVAAQVPQRRAAWGQQAREAVQLGLEGPSLALESAVARIALEWALVSSYATDGLFDALADGQWDCLIGLQGFQLDPLTQTLLDLAGVRSLALPLSPESLGQGYSPPAHDALHLHMADDPQDEAQRAAACVLAHIDAARVPVALVATDRVLTRRIRAMLGLQHVAVRDETGWKLSTTRMASICMACLRACRWDANTDVVLDWLKHAPALGSTPVNALERVLRRHGVAQWRLLESADALGRLEKQAHRRVELEALVERVTVLRASLAKARLLAQWLQALREVLEAMGVWAALQSDAAGLRLLEVLRLRGGAALEWDRLAQAQRRMSLAEFTSWVDAVLEATSYVPEAASPAEVVILPLSQLLGRSFAALVLPGSDEQRLRPSPEPPGDWTAAQRQALGLPSREQLGQANRAAWHNALLTPRVDVLWRRQDEVGEPVLPSPLVQALRVAGRTGPGDDPRLTQRLATMATTAPQARAPRLMVNPLSATAYDDLRRCPYRFFALRQLGLQESDELESVLDKRDFGLWLHAVLKLFHDGLFNLDLTGSDQDRRRRLLDEAARTVADRMAMDRTEFLPFMSAWPAMREGYLRWLVDHEASGARYSQGEASHRQELGPWILFGKIDRIDTLADGSPLLIDYKTEALSVTRARVADPLEDTQLAFYAALLEHDQLRAAYVNMGEKEGSKTVEDDQVVEARDALVEGLLHDLRRIEAGAVMQALGEGSTCDHCAARGLCRKDFWQ